MTACAQCCTVNPAAARFCMGCGSSLVQAGAGRSGLRFVTVAFCDIAGSTKLAQRFDPQVWSGILEEYFAEVGGALVASGGRLEKFIGDAVVGVFGADGGSEDDAVNAVTGALTAVDRLGIRNEETFSRYSLQLAIRFGVASGRVAMVERDSSFAIGSVMNRAARLQSAAPEDGTAIDVRTWLLVRERLACQPLEPVVAKGFDQPLQAWAVSRDEVVAPPEPVFVNQTDVLSQLGNAVNAASGRPGPTMIGLVGDLGSGKTRILRRLLAECASKRMHTVFIGGFGADESLWRLQQIEQELGGVRTGRAGSPSTAELQWRIRRRFADLSRQGPLVVAVDDYPTSPEALHALLQLPADTPGPVVFVLAGREVPGPARTVVKVPPLSDEHAYELLAQLSDSLDLHSAVPAPVVGRGRGNPLFIEQLAALAADGIDDEVAPSAEAALGSRIDRLAASTRTVLACIGAWTGTPRPGDIDAVCELDEATISQSMAELETMGLAGNRTAAEVAYAHLGLNEKARVHSAIARRLQEHAGAEPALLEIAVAHATRAHEAWHEIDPDSAGERDAARLSAHCLIGAARHAVGRSEVARAAELAARARQLAIPDDGLTLEIAALESYALGASGHIDRALAVISEVDGLAGNPSARVHLSVNRTALGAGDLDTTISLARQVDDPCATARLETIQGLRAARSGDYPQAEDLLRSAYQRMRSFGAGLGVAEIYGNLALFLSYADSPVRDAIGTCMAMREEVAQTPILHAVVSCSTAVLVCRGGDPAAATQMLGEARAVFTGMGHVAGEAGSYEFGSVIAELSDDLTAAREAIQRAERIYVAAGDTLSATRCALRAYILDPTLPRPSALDDERRQEGWHARVLWHQARALALNDATELDHALEAIATIRGSGAALIPHTGCLRIASRLGDGIRISRINQALAASSTA